MKWIGRCIETGSVAARAVAARPVVSGCIFALSILSLVCASATVVSAQDDEASARAKVLGLEKAWNQAYKAGDTQALAAILDNSLVLVEDDGSLKTKSEFLASIKKSAPQ